MTEKLENWIATQRGNFQSGRLEQWKYDLLVAAGYSFESRFDEMFRVGLELFKDFVKLNGHGIVPSTHQDEDGSKKLAQWVNNIRMRHKNGKLSDRQIMILEDSGFIWVVREKHDLVHGDSPWLYQRCRLGEDGKRCNECQDGNNRRAREYRNKKHKGAEFVL